MWQMELGPDMRAFAAYCALLYCSYYVFLRSPSLVKISLQNYLEIWRPPLFGSSNYQYLHTSKLKKTVQVTIKTSQQTAKLVFLWKAL